MVKVVKVVDAPMTGSEHVAQGKGHSDPGNGLPPNSVHAKLIDGQGRKFENNNAVPLEFNSPVKNAVHACPALSPAPASASVSIQGAAQLFPPSFAGSKGNNGGRGSHNTNSKGVGSNAKPIVAKHQLDAKTAMSDSSGDCKEKAKKVLKVASVLLDPTSSATSGCLGAPVVVSLVSSLDNDTLLSSLCPVADASNDVIETVGPLSPRAVSSPTYSAVPSIVTNRSYTPISSPVASDYNGCYVSNPSTCALAEFKAKQALDLANFTIASSVPAGQHSNHDTISLDSASGLLARIPQTPFAMHYTCEVEPAPPFTFFPDTRPASVPTFIGTPEERISPNSSEKLLLAVENGFAETRVSNRAISASVKTVISGLSSVDNRLQAFQTHTTGQITRIDSNIARVDTVLEDMVRRVAHLESTPAAPRASSAPARTRHVVTGLDHYEVRIANWPTRTRTEDAGLFVHDKIVTPSEDIPIVSVPPLGGYIPQWGMVVRFQSLEDRSIFLKDRKDKVLEFTNRLGAVSALTFKPIIPKEIAVLSDMLGYTIYLMHRQLESQPIHHKEMVRNYRVRECCLYDIPVCYYSDESGEQNYDKSEGTFTLFAANLTKTCGDKGINFDLELLIREVKNRFPDRAMKIV